MQGLSNGRSPDCKSDAKALGVQIPPSAPKNIMVDKNLNDIHEKLEEIRNTLSQGLGCLSWLLVFAIIIICGMSVAVDKLVDCFIK